jgi:hypothetical protein
MELVFEDKHKKPFYKLGVIKVFKSGVATNSVWWRVKFKFSVWNSLRVTFFLEHRDLSWAVDF